MAGWYKVVDERHLEQCDLLPNVPVLTITNMPQPDEIDKWEPEAEPVYTDLIVVSQTCDLDRTDFNTVLLARYQSWTKIVQAADQARDKNRRRQLRKGQVGGQIVLPPHTEGVVELDWSVIDLKSLYTLSKNYLEACTVSMGSRLRVLPPYRQGIIGTFSGWINRPEYMDDLILFDEYDPR
jgi:hypothetical protein